ncbi:MAG: hypothetical protein A2Y62_13770 [Candidatus Fischerbacteria bacterium RBG_13_37_8]|uniref:PqqD family protein n=1 Tax=Candidatus Fischerbacteria bacterium RBG_13_37_8 TaxID=1817863 RepID=A0A1F5VXA7_9BACT|nr:MAG: hypothetical protein A2Y62_13770 [Candidatus Fischerbacteria bacterium RBG_13_37_8]
MKYKIAKNISYRMLENDIVILNHESGYYYVLNETASKIWEFLFVKKVKLRDTIENFVSEYKIEEQILKYLLQASC